MSTAPSMTAQSGSISASTKARVTSTRSSARARRGRSALPRSWATFSRSSPMRPFLLAVLVLMAGIDWRLLPVLLVAVVIALPVRLHFTRALFDWQRRRVQMERRAGYLDWLITSDIHAKELRLHGLGDWLRDAYSDLRRRIRAEQLRIEERRALSELVVAVVGAGVFIGAATYLVHQVMAGAFSLGDLVLFLLLFRRAETTGVASSPTSPGSTRITSICASSSTFSRSSPRSSPRRAEADPRADPGGPAARGCRFPLSGQRRADARGDRPHPRAGQGRRHDR